MKTAGMVLGTLRENWHRQIAILLHTLPDVQVCLARIFQMLPPEVSGWSHSRTWPTKRQYS